MRPQLNQIRAWLRQGRTDAWIAHQLEVSTSQLRDFIHRNELGADEADPSTADVDLRDEIEAEIEAAEQEEAERGDSESEPESADAEQGEERPARRRRRRRGGRGRGRRRRPGVGMDATFEHGADNGYVVKLDDSIKDDPIYAEHWAERTELKVTVEPNRILVEPVGEPEPKPEPEAGSPGESEEDSD